MIFRKLSFLDQILKNEITRNIVLTGKSEISNQILEYIGFKWTNKPKEENINNIQRLIKKKKIQLIKRQMIENIKSVAVKYLLENKNNENDDLLQST